MFTIIDSRFVVVGKREGREVHTRIALHSEKLRRERTGCGPIARHSGTRSEARSRSDLHETQRQSHAESHVSTPTDARRFSACSHEHGMLMGCIGMCGADCSAVCQRDEHAARAQCLHPSSFRRSEQG